MGCKRFATVGASLVVALTLSLPTSAEAKHFAELLKGGVNARSEAALALLSDYENQSKSVVRRALLVASESPVPKHMPKITTILNDEGADNLTRQAAALALGVIGRDHADIWPPGEGEPDVHKPLPVFARKALLNCVKRGTVTPVRRACAEALGVAGIPEALSTLVELSEDDSEDPAVRIFAGRSVTRLTGQLSVSRESLDALVQMTVSIVDNR